MKKISPGQVKAICQRLIRTVSDSDDWCLSLRVSNSKNLIILSLYSLWGFPGGLAGKEYTCSARDLGSIPGSGISPREGNSNPLQYPGLGNPMDRGAWWATVCGVVRVGHDLATKLPPCSL